VADHRESLWTLMLCRDAGEAGGSVRVRGRGGWFRGKARSILSARRKEWRRARGACPGAQSLDPTTTSSIRDRSLRGRRFDCDGRHLPGGRIAWNVSLRWSSIRRLGFERILALAWVVAVVSVSVSAHGRVGWVRALAASPDRIREGKLWFLLSSAALVDHPLVLSLVCFVALAALARAVCEPRVFWLSAFFGQVIATLLVYVLVIGSARLVVPGAFDSVVAAPDYGVSAISAAWLGTIATASWRRRDRSRAGKVSIALSCVTVGLFAYSVRPDLTVLSSEHLVAFILGIGVAVPAWRSRMLSARWRWPVAATRASIAAMRVKKLDPFSVGAMMFAFVVLAIAEAPTALATLREQVAIHLHPTVGRCAANWNFGSAAPRLLVEGRGVDRVSIQTFRLVLSRESDGTQEPAKWADYCRYTFSEPSRSTVILGLWQHGRVKSWRYPTGKATTGLRANWNATIRRNGRVNLLHRGSPHSAPVLSS
jgi:hypothetical protein